MKNITQSTLIDKAHKIARESSAENFDMIMKAIELYEKDENNAELLLTMIINITQAHEWEEVYANKYSTIKRTLNERLALSNQRKLEIA